MGSSSLDTVGWSEFLFEGMGRGFLWKRKEGRKEGARTYGYGYVQGISRYCIESRSGRESG